MIINRRRRRHQKWRRLCRRTLALLLIFTFVIGLLLCCWRLLFLTVQNSDEIRAKIAEIQRNISQTRQRLEQLKLVLRENSEELPTESHFGTHGSLRDICAGNDSQRCVRRFRRFESRWRIAPNYGLVGCLIQKSMSTLLEALMCLLFDEHTFLANNRTLQTEFSKTRLCLHQNEYNQIWRLRKAVGGAERLREMTFFAIVRHPVDRFLSGFVDKCVRQNFCLGCGTNLSCFVQAEYGRMMAEAVRPRMQMTFLDRHLFPQNWRCNFNSMLANYTLLRVPNPKFPDQPLADQLMQLVVSNARPPARAEPVARLLRQQLVGGGGNHTMTLHSTQGTKVRRFFAHRLQQSPFLMEFVVRMFWHDFQLFGFEVPDLRFD